MTREPNIVLFSAPIQSGKTSALMEWVKDKKAVGGVLAPDIDGLRYVFTLHDRKLHPFQAADETADQLSGAIVRIGRFSFFEATFELIKQTLRTDSRRDCDWLIIDEIGKLELLGQGYEPAAGEVIHDYLRKKEGQGKLLLVVRSQLLEDVQLRYRLEKCRVIESRDVLFSTL